jgi:hypothetical protein
VELEVGEVGMAKVAFVVDVYHYVVTAIRHS